MKRSSPQVPILLSAKRPRTELSLRLTSLPSKILSKILQFCELREVTSLARTCRKLNASCLSYLLSSAATLTIFPFLAPSRPLSDSQLQQLDEEVLIIRGKPHIMLGTSNVKENFVELGQTLKKLTCLMPTAERMHYLCRILSSLDVKVVQESHLVQNRQIFGWIGVLLHTLVLGWADRECETSSSLLVANMREGAGLDTLLGEEYSLGSSKGLEVCYRQYWWSVYHWEVPGGQEQLWLDSLLLQTAADNNQVVARVLLIMSTPAKENVKLDSYGIQWDDHVEAIPANWNVANSRYSRLVKLLKLVRSGSLKERFNSILKCLFTSPGQWLAENVGSVLLLLGEQVSSQYLNFLCLGCVDCRDKFVSTAITGLALMTVR